MTAKELKRTAYHEAGHAVAAIVHRRPFKYVTIVPNDEEGSLGHLMHKEVSKKFHPDCELLTLRGIDLLERMAVVSYAGAAGLGLLTKKDFDWDGANEDKRNAGDAISYITVEPDERNAYCKMLSYRARNLIRNNKQAVRDVADLLLDKQRVSSQAVRAIVSPPDPWAADLRKRLKLKSKAG